jgi:hypothetical protein
MIEELDPDSTESYNPRILMEKLNELIRDHNGMVAIATIDDDPESPDNQ